MADGEAGSRAEVPAALIAELGRWRRELCASCGTSAMFYCPYCCAPLGVPEGVTVPRPRLPFARCDIIFDDAPKKATSIHAKVLVPNQVRLIDLFTGAANSNRTLSRPAGGSSVSDSGECGVLREIPEYDPASSVILFPDDSSTTFNEFVAAEGTPSVDIVTLIIIDSPWRKAQILRKHPRLAHLRSVRLERPPPSHFWRYHSEGTGCVSSVRRWQPLQRRQSLPPLP